MEITLPKEVLSGLPAPDDNGLVRVTVALRVHDDKADLVEVNDTPMPDDTESADAAGPGDVPSPNQVEQQSQY